MNASVRLVAALWFLLLVNYLDRVAISFAGPAIMQSLALGPAQFGIVLSSFGIGYLVAQIPAGMLADKWGARTVLIVAPILWALFTGLTGLVSSIAGFVVLRICLGLSEGLFFPPSHKLVGDTFPAKARAKVIAVILTASALAPALASPMVGALVSSGGWRTMFAVMTVPALAAALCSRWAIPAASAEYATPGGERVLTAASFARILGDPGLWLISVAFLGYNIAFWGYVGWMPTYLVQAHQIDLASLGPLGGIPYVFGFAGLVLGGWLGSTWLHRRRPQMMACFLLIASMSLYLAFQAESLVSCLVGLSAAAFFLFGCSASIGATVLDLAPPAYRATYSAASSTVGQLGPVIAPGAVGFLVAASGTFAGGFAFMIGALAVGAAAMIALVPRLAGHSAPAASQS
ncbi:MAG: MFS transporter [Sphingomonadaceae bacterium]|nr:MFS transporter [Sphingomonadaceae bacterium]